MALKIEEICIRAQSLPVSPTVLPRLLELLGREELNLEDLEEVIQTDTGLSAAVLKMANSISFGGRGQYSEIAQAILYLGFPSTHELMMTVAGGRWNAVDVDGYAWQPGDFFRHNFAVVVAASTIAKQIDFPSPETTYAAGLMHEAGKLALAFVSPESINAIRIFQEEHSCRWIEAERAALGFAHNDISATLLKKWNFPKSLIEVGAFYPVPKQASEPNQTLVQVIHVAKHLAIQTGIGVGEDEFWLDPKEEVLEALGLVDDDLEGLLIATLEKIEKVLGGNTLAGAINL